MEAVRIGSCIAWRLSKIFVRSSDLWEGEGRLVMATGQAQTNLCGRTGLPVPTVE